LTVGSDNVAIGKNALEGDTKGSKSVAIGRNALGTQNFTTATNAENVAVGYHAGTSVSTGLANTLIGSYAGDSITTGLDDVALGYKAAEDMTIGRFNIAIGTQALGNETVGDRSIAIGYQSGYYQVSDSNNEEAQNVYVGMYSGHYNVTGTANTAIGYQALYGATTNSASSNTAVGKNAGLLCRGASNTFVGQLSGDAVSTGTLNSIFWSRFWWFNYNGFLQHGSGGKRTCKYYHFSRKYSGWISVRIHKCNRCWTYYVRN